MTEQTPKYEVAKMPKNVADDVLAKVKALESRGELMFPKNYSYENALKAAYITLQGVEDRNHKKALEVCTKGSVAMSLLDMVVQGLSPSKKQCYFVVYGKNLTLMRSYFGSVAVAKRAAKLKDLTAEVIRKGDEFVFHRDEYGRKIIDKHVTKFQDLDNEIIGAYATMIFEDGTVKSEIMTKKEILAAWGQGAAKGNSPAHKNFPQEMAKKTVINRACKILINTSDDSDVVVEAYNRTTEAEYEIHDVEPEPEQIAEEVAEELEKEAAKEELDFDEPEEAETEDPDEFDAIANAEKLSKKAKAEPKLNF